MLGQGVSATVKATTYNGRPAAVKNFFGRGDSFISENFILEVTILTKLNHPYVISLYGVEIDWHKERCRIFLPLGVMNLMQLVEGEDNFDIREMGEQIALGLLYLQNMNIFHGDIKPENIIVMEDLTPKIADFGIAVLNAGTFAAMTQEANTFHYKSPEILLASGYDFSVYSWDFGLLMYFMKKGKNLFTVGNSVREQFMDIFEKIGGSDHWTDGQHRSFVLHGVHAYSFFAQSKFSSLTSNPLLNDLLHHTVTTNPENRLSLRSILEHKYFAVHTSSTVADVSCLDQLQANSVVVAIPDDASLFAEILDRNQLVPYTDVYACVFVTTVQIYSRFCAKRSDLTLRELVLPCLRLACAVCSEDFEWMMEELTADEEDLGDLYFERYMQQSRLDEITEEILKTLNYDLWFTTDVDYARLEGEDLLVVYDSLM